MIGPFRGKYSWLSNFFPCRIMIDGEMYKTIEHAYQAMKTTDIDARERIREASVDEAKHLGGQVELRPGWEAGKVTVMLHLLRAKFSKPVLRRLLLKTGDEELVEVNTWGDTFWGVYRGVGENTLGQLLMRVRSEIGEEDDR